LYTQIMVKEDTTTATKRYFLKYKEQTKASIAKGQKGFETFG